jgi:hypothetical protein
MNIFILSWCVEECARFHFDRHVVKMILEMAQILSTAHYLLPLYQIDQTTFENIYKPINKKHPCCVWVSEHVNNYRYTVELGLALCKEYTFRYEGRVHKTERVLKFLKENEPPSHLFTKCKSKNFIGKYKVTEPMQAMPPRFRVEGDVITSYMQYYHADSKAYLRSWKMRDVPWWFDDMIVLKTPPDHLTSNTKVKQVAKFYNSHVFLKR